MKKLKKWIIPYATAALLGSGGYMVGDFNADKGYPVIDTVMVKEKVIIIDTVWYADSAKLDSFATFGFSTFAEE